MPRIANVVLGAWLALSALAWPHEGPEGLNAIMTGLFVAMIAAMAVWAPVLRLGNLFLAAWLAGSTLMLDHASELTRWNELLVAGAIAAAALVRSASGRRRGAAARGPGAVR